MSTMIRRTTHDDIPQSNTSLAHFGQVPFRPPFKVETQSASVQRLLVPLLIERGTKEDIVLHSKVSILTSKSHDRRPHPHGVLQDPRLLRDVRNPSTEPGLVNERVRCGRYAMHFPYIKVLIVSRDIEQQHLHTYQGEQ